MNSSMMADYWFSLISEQKEIKNTDKIRISLVYYDMIEGPCILKECKGRDLSATASVLKNIRHPNIAVIYDYLYANGNTYILEEYVAGKTLQDILDERGPFSEKETIRIIGDVCRGLEKLHSLNPPLIHNDIKSSNIMLREDGTVKLFDFDISRVYKDGADKNTRLMGTEEYAAPEHFGYGQSDPRTDIYSLGVTMHQMLTGKCLGNNHKVVYHGKLEKVIRRCVEVDPKNRHASTQELLRDLKNPPVNVMGRICAWFVGIVIAILLIACVFAFVRPLMNDRNIEQQSTNDQLINGESHWTDKIVGRYTAGDGSSLTICESRNGYIIAMNLVRLTSIIDGTSVSVTDRAMTFSAVTDGGDAIGGKIEWSNNCSNVTYTVFGSEFVFLPDGSELSFQKVSDNEVHDTNEEWYRKHTNFASMQKDTILEVMVQNDVILWVNIDDGVSSSPYHTIFEVLPDEIGEYDALTYHSEDGCSITYYPSTQSIYFEDSDPIYAGMYYLVVDNFLYANSSYQNDDPGDLSTESPVEDMTSETSDFVEDETTTENVVVDKNSNVVEEENYHWYMDHNLFANEDCTVRIEVYGVDDDHFEMIWGDVYWDNEVIHDWRFTIDVLPDEIGEKGELIYKGEDGRIIYYPSENCISVEMRNQNYDGIYTDFMDSPLR